ncbi:unnamed protein product [Moneuplotes crassus]|uniref:Uncharacterized protein n=1 Tax=Euplotes crassus TaxID=5936 RepID=A0AAD1X4L4_EUPCR|nr:unnamed protein product [Moneuplotes crassus]
MEEPCMERIGRRMRRRGKGELGKSIEKRQIKLSMRYDYFRNMLSEKRKKVTKHNTSFKSLFFNQKLVDTKILALSNKIAQNASYVDIINTDSRKGAIEPKSLYSVPHKQFKSKLVNHKRAQSNALSKRIRMAKQNLPAFKGSLFLKLKPDTTSMSKISLNKSSSGVQNCSEIISGSISIQRTAYKKRRKKNALTIDTYCSPKTMSEKPDLRAVTCDSPEITRGINAKGITLENRLKVLENLNKFLTQEKKYDEKLDNKRASNSCSSPAPCDPLEARIDIKVKKATIVNTSNKPKVLQEPRETFSKPVQRTSKQKYTMVKRTIELGKVNNFETPKNDAYSETPLFKEHKYCEIRNLNFIRSVKEDARRRRVHYNQCKTDASIETGTSPNWDCFLSSEWFP